MSMKNKVVMVTGGAGFIGSHLVDRLTKENPEKILIVDNFFLGKHRNIEQAMRENDNVLLFYQDVAHYEKMKNLMEMQSVDVVFNLAVVPLLTSHVLPKITCEDNINITLAVLELQREGFFKTLIHCSSSEAYGSALTFPMSENHPLKPTTPYAASKAASDLLALSYYNTFELDLSIVRPFNNYGPRQNEGSYAGVIPITIQRILDGKPPIVHGDGLQTRDYIYVEDTADSMVQIYNSKNTRGKVINIATGKEITILDMVKAIAKEMEYEGKIEFQAKRTADVMRHQGDISVAKQLFNFELHTSFEKGIRKTVRWYEQVMRKKAGH
ncbi:MAG: SDR family NAD(P)-dependent oxidoreductase [Candidatus Thermoplasmatota archaeon]|nr:SDR family NAD(P)-dependent oxidoreductase [Candidatus Thermoplasmatota archaeon]